MRRFSLVLALALVGCHSPPSGAAHAELTSQAASSIADEEGWEALASRPLNHHVARTEVVKFVIDLRSASPRVLFLQSRRYESHYDFVSEHLSHDFHDGYDFYRRVYRTEDRPFIVGSIVRYRDADAWTLELISGDELSAERILWTMEQVRPLLFSGAALRFRPTSGVHLARIEELGDRIAVADDAELYRGILYQPIQLGVAYGTLRVVRGEVPRGRLGPHDVLVTDQVPDDLPLVAALVTSRFQAPLAHVAVLSGNRGTPDMALRGAVDDPRVSALEGRLVRIEVGAQEFRLSAATMEEALAAWGDAVVREPFDPPLDLASDGLLDQCSLGLDDVDVAGAKASNMGVLCGLSDAGVRVPEGFVVPFARYFEHLRAHQLDARVDAFLRSDARRGDPTEALEELRRGIVEAPVHAALLAEIRDRIRALAPTGRVRLRSSTNAEDMPGFNGAGLYGSSIFRVDGTDEDLARALREVWASVWNLGAFQEREHYRIDHAHVAMAVLVQVSVDDAVANGVAITANPYDPIRPGVLVNIQATGASVTGARGDQMPEQWLVFTYLPSREPELIARSSLTGGAAILGRVEVLEITRQLEVIHERFVPTFRDGSNAVDVELLVAGEDRHAVFVQARPHRVVWQGREGVAR
jgi:hypothetical protein